jgi:hypothetical protein
MISERTSSLRKSFQLRWATRDQARIHSYGEWQLRFKDGAARDLANRKLRVDHWLSRRDPPGDEVIYTFINDAATLSEVFATLVAGGLPEKEIEIEGHGARFEAVI